MADTQTDFAAQTARGKLHGKNAIVTGSSSGNGRAIAIALARHGANVLCSDIQREAREGGYEGYIQRPTDEVIAELGVGGAYHDATRPAPTEVEALVKAAAWSSGAWTSWSTTPASSPICIPIVDETEEQWTSPWLSTPRACSSAANTPATPDSPNRTKTSPRAGRSSTSPQSADSSASPPSQHIAPQKALWSISTRQIAVDYAPGTD